MCVRSGSGNLKRKRFEVEEMVGPTFCIVLWFGIFQRLKKVNKNFGTWNHC